MRAAGRRPGILACFLLLLLTTGLPQVGRSAPPALVGEVLRVYDGDTLEVDGIGKVRLLGIDVPEREPSARDRFFGERGVPPARLRRIYAEASGFTRRTVKGKTVNLTLDREPRDRHGRLLAYVYLPDGRLLNRLLLEEGLAAVYRRFDFARKEEFLAAEAEARQAGRGLWKNQ